MKKKKKKLSISFSILIIFILLNSNSLSSFNAKAFANRNTNQLNTYTLEDSIWMWTTTTVVSTDSTDESWYPKIATDSNDNMHFVWQEQNYAGTGADWDVFYKRWNSSTSLWTTTELVSTGSTNHSVFPAIAVDAVGNVNIAWHEEIGSEYDIYYKYWNASISNWSSTERVSTESTSTSQGPSLAVDSTGNVHIAWYDYSNYLGAGTDRDIFYKYWNASSSTWSITEVVSTESTSWSDWPSLAVDSVGNVYIAWQDYTAFAGSGGDADIFYNYWSFSTSSWNATEVISTGSSDGSGNPSITVDTIGNVYIVWEDYTDHYLGSGTDVDIFYRCWNSTTSSWTDIELVTTESDDLSVDASIAVDSIGNVHVTWKQWYGIFYKFWDSYSSTWTSVEMISTESTMDVQNPSLAVDTTRNVHIVWADNTDYDSSGSDRDIFYKQTEEPPVFPEIVSNLSIPQRVIVLAMLISLTFISLLIVKKRYKILNRTS